MPQSHNHNMRVYMTNSFIHQFINIPFAELPISKKKKFFLIISLKASCRISLNLQIMHTDMNYMLNIKQRKERWKFIAT